MGDGKNARFHLSFKFLIINWQFLIKIGWPVGLEPTASRATTWRSNQLNYGHHRRIKSPSLQNDRLFKAYKIQKNTTSGNSFFPPPRVNTPSAPNCEEKAGNSGQNIYYVVIAHIDRGHDQQRPDAQQIPAALYLVMKCDP